MKPITLICAFILTLSGILSAPTRLHHSVSVLELQSYPDSLPQQDIERFFKEGMEAYQHDDFTAALKSFESGLARAEAAHDEKAMARFLNGIGNVYSTLSQFGPALGYYERTLRIHEKMGDALDIAKSLNNIGVVYDSLGHLDRALDFYLQALQTFEKLGNDRAVAYSLNNIGVTYENLGQLDRALDFYQQTLRINEKLGNEPDLAKSLNNMGIICTQLGQFDRGLAYHQRAQKINEKLGNALDIALSITGIGDICYREGQFSRALAYYQRALKQKEPVGSEESNAASFVNIGSAYSKLGQPALALDYYHRALAIEEKIGNGLEIAKSLDSIGSLYAEQNHGDQARKYYERALTSMEAISQKVTEPASLGALQDTLPTLSARYACLLRGKADNQDMEALAALEAGRAHGLTQLAAQARMDVAALFSRPDAARWKAASDELSNAAGLLAAADARMEQTATAKDAASPKEAAQKQHNSAVSQYEATQRQWASLRSVLMERYPRFRHIYAPPRPTAHQFKTLADRYPDTLFIEWGVLDDKRLLVFTLDHTHGVQGTEVTLDTNALEESIRAYDKIRGLSGSVTVDRPSGSILARAVTAWRSSIEQGRYLSGSQSPIGKEGERLRKVALCEKRLAGALYQALFNPLFKGKREALRRYQRLMLVGDGPLLDMPFAALWDANGYRLIDRCAVATAVSLHLLLQPVSDKQPTGTLLCAADPVGIPSARIPAVKKGATAMDRARLEPLVHAREEARQIAGLFPESVQWTGWQASEAAIKSVMDRYRILHFATHGVLNGASGLRSWLALAETARPLSTAEDGRLEAREVMPMQLTAELTVLSACESGRGQRSGGDGLLGLAWGFQAAGCPAVVASLWRVNDTATRDLMVAFYVALKAGKGKDEALREAMLRVRGKGKSQVHAAPFFWAGFQVIGDASPLIFRNR